MKFTLPRDTFLSALSFVGSVIEKRSTIPILMNVKIEVHDGRITFHGTNLDVYLRTWRDATVQSSGAFTIDFASLLSIVRNADDDVSVSVDAENNRATITSGASRFVLMGMTAEDFPTEPEAGKSSALATFSPDVIFPAFAQSSYCITEEETRFQLSGTLLNLTKKTTELCATNGHSMALVTIPAKNAKESKLLVPKGAIAAMLKMTGGGDLTFALGDRLTVERGDCSLSVRLIDVNFPNYRQVIQPGMDYSAVVDREKLLGVVRSVSMMTNERTRTVKVEVGEGRVKVSTVNPEKGEGASSVAGETVGACWFGMSASYLAAALQAIPTDRVRLSAKDENSQLQLTPEPPCEEMDSIHIIMPMRLV